MNKLEDKRGETLIESLVSVLIAALAFAFLATAAVSAEKINAKTRNTDISFRYTTVGTVGAADEKTTSEAAATVKLTGSGTLPIESSGSVKLYTYNDYHYYTAGTAGAEVSAP